MKLDSELLPLFGQNVTLGDISRTKPTSKLGEKDAKATLAVRIADLEKLAARLRRQSLSMLRDFVRRLETT